MKNPKLIALGVGATAFAGLLVGGVATAGASSNPISTFTQSVGLTQAQVSSDDRAAAREAYLQSLADNLGVDIATLEAALSTTSLAALDQAVTDGKITAEEAAEIRTKIESGDSILYGLNGGSRGGHGRHGGHGGGFSSTNTAEIATFLGTDEATLRTELEGGKTLATVAEEAGKSRDELKAFLTAEMTASLTEKVAAGDITQEEADAKVADAIADLDERIDGTYMGKGEGRGHDDSDTDETDDADETEDDTSAVS